MNILSLLADSGTAASTVTSNAYNTFIGIVNVVLPVIMAAVLVFGMFYGIQLGVKYAKAEEDDERKKAKQSLINVIVGCLIIIVFVAVVMIILSSSFIEDLFGSGVTSKV
jgi:O-antigen/teichoic acid export membrane protein